MRTNFTRYCGVMLVSQSASPSSLMVQCSTPRTVITRLFFASIGVVVIREPGAAQPFASVQGAVRMALRQQSFVTAMRQCLQLLAGAAMVEGVALDAAETPLVQ